MMAEMWFVSPLDKSSGFSIVLWPPEPEISDISRGLADKGYRLAETVSNEESQILIKDDCAIGVHFCETQGGSAFIGGTVIPYLSKRNLLGKIAIPTFFIGIALVMLILTGFLIYVAGSIADLLGAPDISQFFGTLYIPTLYITIIVGLIIIPFVVMIYVIPYPSRKTPISLMNDLKKIVQDRIPDVEIRDFQIRHESKSEKLPLNISEMLEIFAMRVPVSIYNQVLEYDRKY